MPSRTSVAVFALVIGAACASQKPATVEEPPPQQQDQPPPPEPQAKPQLPPARDMRSEVIQLADKIDGELASHKKSTGKDAVEHAQAILTAAERMQEPIAANAASATSYAELRKQAQKLLDASRKNDKKDMEHHRHEIEEALRALRASL